MKVQPVSKNIRVYIVLCAVSQAWLKQKIFDCKVGAKNWARESLRFLSQWILDKNEDIPIFISIFLSYFYYETANYYKFTFLGANGQFLELENPF